MSTEVGPDHSGTHSYEAMADRFRQRPIPGVFMNRMPNQKGAKGSQRLCPSPSSTRTMEGIHKAFTELRAGFLADPLRSRVPLLLGSTQAQGSGPENSLMLVYERNTQRGDLMTDAYTGPANAVQRFYTDRQHPHWRGSISSSTQDPGGSRKPDIRILHSPFATDSSWGKT